MTGKNKTCNRCSAELFNFNHPKKARQRKSKRERVTFVLQIKARKACAVVIDDDDNDDDYTAI